MSAPPPRLHLSSTAADAADNEAMYAHQEEGWPLGLRPLDVRAGRLVRNRHPSLSLSYSTLLTASPSHFSHSTDFDSESTGSICPGNSVTLGSLMGVSNNMELSRRSSRGRTATEASRRKVRYKSKNWCFLLCSKLTTDAINMRNAPSLGHFIHAERKIETVYKKRHNPLFYSPHNIQQDAIVSEADYTH
ncbi:hypothetical protein QQ045_029875 [Rhodiola kirilowii]